MRQPSRLLLPLLLYPACALALLLGGCSTMGPAAVHRGETQVAPLTSSELAQSDVNRMSTLAMRNNLDSLYRLIDKLYRRNPAEWRKTSSVSREAAIERVRSAIDSRTPWPELQGKRDIAALSLSLALSPEFKGDRVAAFIYASADMLIVAHDGKTTFYLVDGLDAQHIYNAARNVESAVWLLADEISERERNLSFEREFGKMVGRLDLLSEVLTEKYRRAVISYVQNLAGASFLQFLPVR